jgi:hypothetical protein
MEQMAAYHWLCHIISSDPRAVIESKKHRCDPMDIRDIEEAHFTWIASLAFGDPSFSFQL